MPVTSMVPTVLKGLVVLSNSGSAADQRNRSIACTGFGTREPACQPDLWGFSIKPYIVGTL